MHVVITGASAGIGSAFAREYAKSGAKLTLVARRRPLLEELAKEVGGAPHVVDKDLSDSDNAADFLPGAIEANGPVDVLVNNAGTQLQCRWDKLDIDKAEATLRLNLMTPLRLAHAVAPDMLERRSGTIINVSSAAAWAYLPGITHYIASKAGIALASEALRAELRFTGVHVLTAYPGYISTSLGDAGYDGLEMPAYAKIYRPGDAAIFAKKCRRAADKKRERVVYPVINRFPMVFPNSIRFLMDRLAPPLKDGI
jgi:short-subunit dehydrogenase